MAAVPSLWIKLPGRNHLSKQGCLDASIQSDQALHFMVTASRGQRWDKRQPGVLDPIGLIFWIGLNVSGFEYRHSIGPDLHVVMLQHL